MKKRIQRTYVFESTHKADLFERWLKKMKHDVDRAIYGYPVFVDRRAANFDTGIEKTLVEYSYEKDLVWGVAIGIDLAQM